MATQRLNITLDGDLSSFLDRYRTLYGLGEAEVITQALQLLRQQELRRQYAEALQEWHESGEAALWENTVGDGLTEEF